MAIYSLLLGVYSLLLAVALGVSAPWWLWRMATSGRYREGLAGRLGFVPEELRAAVAGLAAGRTVWVHAVSVGEVLAAERLIEELREALPGWVVAVSTTTATGQKIARERLGGCPVFYFPLDFAFTVRAYLRVLRPGLMVLVESEFWPRLLVECERAGVPVAVVNARVSDRSFPRYMRLRWVWKRVLGRVSLFLAQGEESGERLRRIGAERVRVVGNLKYDLNTPRYSTIARSIKYARGASRVIVAGSTLDGEEAILLDAWPKILRGGPDFVMVIAPRHPDRFDRVWAEIQKTGYKAARCSVWVRGKHELENGTILLLDTVGDLAAVYSTATVAFIGGSLVPKGGHNPLEAARYGKPIVMGQSYENFREIVTGMGTIRIVKEDQLAEALISSSRYGQERGRRGQKFFDGQAGATGRTVEALLELVGGRR